MHCAVMWHTTTLEITPHSTVLTFTFACSISAPPPPTSSSGVIASIVISTLVLFAAIVVGGILLVVVGMMMIRKKRLSSPRTTNVVHDQNVVGNYRMSDILHRQNQAAPNPRPPYQYTPVTRVCSECNEKKVATEKEAKGYSDNAYDSDEEKALIA